MPSVYYSDNKRFFYHEIFKNPPSDLTEAVKRIVPKIDMAAIHGIVDSTPIISEIRKEYLNKAIDMRYEQILLPALKRVLRHEKEKSTAQNTPQKDMSQTKSTLMERLEKGKQKAAQQGQTDKPTRKKRDSRE